MGILIRGGRIVDAATDTDKTGDIYLEDGIITEIGQKLKKNWVMTMKAQKKSCERETIWQICQGSWHLDLWQM